MTQEGRRSDGQYDGDAAEAGNWLRVNFEDVPGSREPASDGKTKSGAVPTEQIPASAVAVSRIAFAFMLAAYALRAGCGGRGRG